MLIITMLCQIRNETPELARGAAKAVYELYDVVTHELLSSDLRYMIGQMMQKKIGMITFFKICKFLFIFYFSREQLDTWNILARPRNEGRLFSSIAWPKDPEIVSISGSAARFPLILLHNGVCIYQGSFILFVATDRASEALASSSYCKGICS